MSTIDQLLMVLMFTTGVFSVMVVFQFKKLLQDVSELRKHNKFVKNGRKLVEKMRLAGEHHDWINIPTSKGNFRVCRKTGYCPSEDGFVPLKVIVMWENNKKNEEDYKKHRDLKIEELAIEQGITVEEMESLVETIFNMKKQFFINKMENSLNEIKKLKNKITNNDEEDKKLH